MPITVRTTDNITVCGMRGSGKTTLEKYLAGRMPRIYVFDPLDEYGDLPNVGGRYIPKTDDPLELDDICRQLFNLGNVVLLVSEAELYLPNTALPSNTLKFLLRGRHRNTALWADTRRIALLSKTVLSQSEHLFVFYHWSKTDLDALREYINEPQLIRELPDYHFLHYQRRKLTKYQPVKVG